MIFKTFDQFLTESQESISDLKKVYLTINPKSGHRWWSFKGFAGDKFFTQVTLENYQDLGLSKEYPVLNYNSEVTNTLIEKGYIKKENVYNLPENAKDSGDKVKFHKLFEDDKNLPKTVYDKKTALKELKFPIIAKPTSGHSGIGIQIFKEKEELEDSKDKFDLFSEFVNKSEEHRFFLFNGEPFFWMERKPMNSKAEKGEGDTKEEMSFKYIKRNVRNIDGETRDLIKRFSEKLNLPFICFDVMKSESGKPYIIESNSQPGVPYNSTVKLYEYIFEDFYKRQINSSDQQKLKEYSDYLDIKTLELDPERFEIQKN